MNNTLIGILNVKQANVHFLRRTARRDDKITAARHERLIAASRQGVNDMVHGAEGMLTTTHRPIAV